MKASRKANGVIHTKSMSRFEHCAIFTEYEQERTLRNINKYYEALARHFLKVDPTAQFPSFANICKKKPFAIDPFVSTPLNMKIYKKISKEDLEPLLKRKGLYTKVFCFQCREEIKLHTRYFSKRASNAASRIRRYHVQCARQINLMK
jgi:hypothetical protein